MDTENMFLQEEKCRDLRERELQRWVSERESVCVWEREKEHNKRLNAN